MADLRYGPQILIKQQQDLIGLLGVGTNRQFYIDLQGAFICFWHVLRSHDAQRNQQKAAQEQGDDACQQFSGMLQAISQQRFIAADCCSFQIIKKVPNLSFWFIQPVSIQPGRHHRRKGKRNHKGHQRGKNNGEGKLPEQLPRGALHKCDGQKNNYIAQGHGNGGHTDLHAALFSSVCCIVPVLQKTVNVFQHNNGVVYQDADAKGHAHEGHHVESKTGQVH